MIKLEEMVHFICGEIGPKRNVDNYKVKIFLKYSELLCRQAKN